MRTLFLTFTLLLVAGVASAQTVIESPEFGTVVYKEIVLEKDGSPVENGSSSSTTVDSDSFAAGLLSFSSIDSDIGTFFNENEARGVLEFDLENADIPAYFTTNNFTAKLIGLAGVPYTDTIAVSIDLYDMKDELEDLVITEGDFDVNLDEGSINSVSVVNGAFPEEGIDVTAQLRKDLFGTDDTGVSSGFVLMAVDGTGLIKFDAENAYIEMNLAEIDTDSSSDADTDTDTDSDSDSDTDSDSDSDTDSDTDADSDADSDYWETDDTDSSGITEITDPDVTCSCNQVGGSLADSILRLLF